MPLDHYKMSMENKPLWLLYSKYAPQAQLTQGSVRPLGSVRKRESSEQGDRGSLSQLEDELSNIDRVERYLAMSEGAPGLVDMYGSRRSLQSLAGSSDTSRIQGKGPTKSREFENRYKIAVSRNPQEPRPSIYSKRVIHLPLLKINLETYMGDTTEDSQTLDTTRKSLRHIIDVNRKSKLPQVDLPATVIRQPGITQYHFKTPGDSEKEALGQSKVPLFDRVPPGQEHLKHEDFESEDILRLESVGDEYAPSETSRTLYGHDVIYEIPEDEEWEDDGMYEMWERGVDDTSVMAQRLSSAATLGNLDPDSELGTDDQSRILVHKRRQHLNGREQSGGVPHWPSFKDMRNLGSDYPQASLAIHPRMPRDARNHPEKGTSVIIKPPRADSFVVKNGAAPKLKYTKHSHHSRIHSKRKLDPIASVHHSAKDCPMCNLFKVKEPTLCPPNTPRHPGDMVPDIITPLNLDTLEEHHQGEVGEEEEQGEGKEVDETDKSDIEFRKRHRLLNYDISDVTNTPSKLAPIHKELSSVGATEVNGIIQLRPR